MSLVLLAGLVAHPDASAQFITKKDTTIILISDLGVQLECTQALNDLYNFKFAEAEYQFQYSALNTNGIRFLIF